MKLNTKTRFFCLYIPAATVIVVWTSQILTRKLLGAAARWVCWIVLVVLEDRLLQVKTSFCQLSLGNLLGEPERKSLSEEICGKMRQITSSVTPTHLNGHSTKGKNEWQICWNFLLFFSRIICFILLLLIITYPHWDETHCGLWHL